MARLWQRLPWPTYVLLDLWNLLLERYHPVTSHVSHPVTPEVSSECHKRDTLWVPRTFCSSYTDQVRSIPLPPPCQVTSVSGHLSVLSTLSYSTSSTDHTD